MRRSLPSGLGFALAVQAAFAFALLGGAWAVERQWLDGARLVAVLVLLVRFIEPLAQLTHLDQALRGAWQALDTLLRVSPWLRCAAPSRASGRTTPAWRPRPWNCAWKMAAPCSRTFP